MRKILYIVPYLSIGGTEKHVLDLVSGFSADNEIFLLAPPGETLELFQAEKLTYYPFPRLDKKPLQGLRKFFSQLKKILRANSIDLIHIHGAPELILLVKLVTRKIPVIFTLHGFHGPRKDWDYWGCARTCNRFAAQVIAVAEVEEEILKARGLKPELIRTIHNGVPDPQKLSFEKPANLANIPVECLLIGAIARLETTKGINFLLDAFAQLANRFAQIHLIIVGSGSKERELVDQAERLQISSQVTFAGYQQNVHDYLHYYDIFAIPSLHEAHPLVLMEGMGHAKPIVATTVGGIPEVIVEGENGLLVPPADATALVEALERLVTEDDLRQGLGVAARATYERDFTVDRMLRETAELYTNLLDKLSSIRKFSRD